MTNFILYSRVARRAAPQPSQDEQLDRCVAYLAAKGWANVAAYVDATQGDDG